ncbi:hypothetical protein [Hyphomicrobium sp.]|uniref:hypothetical protein n=1 Tax=Hyphomicrobium sp. TaxID=82 RepID=UPI001DDF5080|nr:hypothetical protein [Hyphomicrobium sp.]MBY0560009.1 hypothetical protein [Hyphomicrobium sp.]
MRNIAAALILLATPAIAQEFEPMGKEQEAEAMPLQRELATCWNKTTAKPYKTDADLLQMIEVDVIEKCGSIAARLKAVLGTSRMEAFIAELTNATWATHPGSEDNLL